MTELGKTMKRRMDALANCVVNRIIDLGERKEKGDLPDAGQQELNFLVETLRPVTDRACDAWNAILKDLGAT